jgi:4-diphosphocytidyl-2-C-methyl-D-erythritol kinase
MIAFPNAKINLGLNILRKRADGYHDIESCFYPIPWKDALEIIPSDALEFSSEGLEIPGDWKNNLCIRAYELLKHDFQIGPVKIILLKKIPMGAGLGGGSADGAFMLSLLNDHFQLNLSKEQLETYALQLGSDCPFFIANRPVIAKGRGEQLEPVELDLKGYWLVIKNPGTHISTKEAYEGINPKQPMDSVRDILLKPIEEWRDCLQNDFEKPIFHKYPELQRLKEELYEEGALYASMTGSGSTVYGIFGEPVELEGWKVFAL